MPGKLIRRGSLGNSPHKFVWYNRTHEEFETLTPGKTGRGGLLQRPLAVPEVEPGYVFVLGECGGKALYHAAGSQGAGEVPCLSEFEDGSFFTVTTQMWGAMELYVQGEECQRQYIRGMRPFPTQPEFTLDYFAGLVAELARLEKRSAKGLLTQDQLIPGLGNAIAQDILFRARLLPGTRSMTWTRPGARPV